MGISWRPFPGTSRKYITQLYMPFLLEIKQKTIINTPHNLTVGIQVLLLNEK